MSLLVPCGNIQLGPYFSGNGLLEDGTKPIPEKWLLISEGGIAPDHISTGNCQNIHLWYEFELLFQIYNRFCQGPMNWLTTWCVCHIWCMKQVATNYSKTHIQLDCNFFTDAKGNIDIQAASVVCLRNIYIHQFVKHWAFKLISIV